MDQEMAVETSEALATPIEHWRYQVETPFLPANEILELGESSVAAEEETWKANAAQVAFREAVLTAHIALRSGGGKRKPARDLPASALKTVPGLTIEMRSDAADAAGQLLADARKALAAARKAGDPDAQRTLSLRATSGYRSPKRQYELWRSYFPKYYAKTQAARSQAVGGEHGRAARQIALRETAQWIAAPGYSNHNAGIAIDLKQDRTGGSAIGNTSKSRDLARWRASWFHGWLVANAGTYGFEPYAKEPWHWEFKPRSKATREEETTANEYAFEELDTENVYETPELEEAHEEEASAHEEESTGTSFEGESFEEEELTEEQEGEEALENEESEGEEPESYELDTKEDEEEEQFEPESEGLEELEESSFEGLESEGATGPGAAKVPLFDQLVFGPTLRRGSKGRPVLALQMALLLSGFSVTPDSRFGPRTEQAVRNLQQQRGLNVDGVVGPKTKAALARGFGGVVVAPTSEGLEEFEETTFEAQPAEAALDVAGLEEFQTEETGADPAIVENARAFAQLAAGPTLRRGTKGPGVDTLQRVLNVRGANLKVDGIFGPKTEAAVRAFQQTAGLKVDGIVGPQTKAALVGATVKPTIKPAAPRLATSLENLRGEANALAPNRSKASDGTIGDAAHRTRASDHNPNAANVVCALDLTHDPAHGFDAHAIAEGIRQRWHPALKYIISNRRIASVKSGHQWRPYTGPNPHSKHIHISVGAGPSGQSTGPYDDPSPWGLSGSGSPVANWSAVPVGQRARHVMELLVDRYGYSVNGAAGLVGNFMGASDVIPNRIQGSSEDTPMVAPNFAGRNQLFTPDQVMNRSEQARRGPQQAGIGIARWSGPGPRSGLFQHRFGGKQLGSAILTNMDAQVDYVATELRNIPEFRELDAMLRSRSVTVDASADAVLFQYQVPGIQKTSTFRRGQAQIALSAYRAAHP